MPRTVQPLSSGRRPDAVGVPPSPPPLPPGCSRAQIDRHIASLNGCGPEEWWERQHERAEARRQRRAEMRERQAERLEEEMRHGRAALEGDIARRARERERGRRRAHKERLQVRGARWAVACVLSRGAERMHAIVLEGRWRAAELSEQNRAARRIQKIWRRRLISVRLRKLMRGRLLLRKGVFWWRMRNRIRAKRARCAPPLFSVWP